MDKEILQKQLEKSWLLAGVNLPLEEVVEKQYSERQILTDRIGNISAVGLILSGRVEVYSVALDGKDVQLNSLLPGECFGISNLLSTSELDTVLRCGENTKILYISKAVFLNCMEQDSGLALRYSKLCNQKIQFLIHRIELLTMQSCRGRLIAHFFAKKDKDGSLRLIGSREDLARQLGISRAALFRELALLQSMEGIRIDGDIITLKNLTLLEDLLYHSSKTI